MKRNCAAKGCFTEFGCSALAEAPQISPSAYRTFQVVRLVAAMAYICRVSTDLKSGKYWRLPMSSKPSYTQ